MWNVIQKFIKKHAKQIIVAITLATLCVGAAYLLGPDSDYTFISNVIVSIAILYYIVLMTNKKEYAKYAKRILYIVCFAVASNHLYLYDNIIKLFPWFARLKESSIILFLIIGFIVVFIVCTLVGHMSSEEEKKNIEIPAPTPERIRHIQGKSVKNIHRRKINSNNTAVNGGFLSIILKIIGIIAIVAVLVISIWLYFKFDFPSLVSNNPIDSMSSFVSSLVGYIVSILFVLFAFALVVIAFVEMARLLFQRILLFREARKTNVQGDNSILAFSFSILLVIASLFLTYKISDLTLEHIVNGLVGGDYLALPLVLLIGIIVVILLLRMTYSILLLIMKPDPLPETSDIKKFGNLIGIKEHSVTIAKCIVQVVLGTIESVLKFVAFVPDFFTVLSSLVLGKEEKKEISDEKKGIRIVKTAAFSFAIVSFVATANGLVNYVFVEPNKQYQAYLISFAIQSILFVLNLKFPSYIAKIFELGKRYKGYIIIGFYVIVLCSSSIFSYVYIVNSVYAKTRYNDANIVLDNAYRKIENDTNNYIREGINFSNLLICEQLAELQDIIKNDVQQESLSDLRSREAEVNKKVSDAEAKSTQCQSDFDIAREKYMEPMTSRWRNQATVADEKEAYEDARDELEKAQTALSAVQLELTTIQQLINDYKPSASNITHDFLVEMLQPTPSIDDYEKDGKQYLGLNSYIGLLNDYVVQIEDDIDVKEFADVVLKTTELTVSVNNYIDYIDAKNVELEEVEIVIPEYGSNDYKKQITEWEKAWRVRLEVLEKKVKMIPEYSFTNSKHIKEFEETINFTLLKRYDPDKVIDKIDNKQRSNFSSINHFERAFKLLFSEYPVLAWFSLILAFFFDCASLLAGLFIYYVEKKDIQGVEKAEDVLGETQFQIIAE